jgi:hypothetical protein
VPWAQAGRWPWRARKSRLVSPESFGGLMRRPAGMTRSGEVALAVGSYRARCGVAGENRMDVGLVVEVVAGAWVGTCVVFVLAIVFMSRGQVRWGREVLLVIADDFLNLTGEAAVALLTDVSDRPDCLARRVALDEFLPLRNQAAVVAAQIPAFFGQQSDVSAFANEVLVSLTEYGRRSGALLSRESSTVPNRTDLLVELAELSQVVAVQRAAFAAAVWVALDAPPPLPRGSRPGISRIERGITTTLGRLTRK